MKKSKPKEIAIFSLKGGVGKSTVCVLVGEAMRQAGQEVLIRDWDEQGTSTKAQESFGAVRTTDPSVIIYDTPPSLEHIASISAVRSADLVVVVTSPAPADLWEAERAVNFAKEKNPSAKVRVMLNKVRKTTVLGKLLPESSKGLGAQVIPKMLSARECYQRAMAEGWKILDTAARAEVLDLTLCLLSFRS